MVPQHEFVYVLELWLPILVSAVIVFIASSVIHMALGYHASDRRSVPDEGAFSEALKKLDLPPGDYMYPKASSMKEMNSPEFQEKLKREPGLVFTMWKAGSSSMTSALVLWFLYSVVIGIFAAYVSGRALGHSAGYLEVFRFTGVTAFACHAIAGWSESIWWKRSWGTTLKNTFDGLVYALLTAGTFGWLWPRP